MAWTAPLTAVENTAWTSAQWNAHITANFAELAPAKATAAARYMVSTSTNNSIAERVPSAALVATSQTTTSTSYTDLTTSGPAVTVTTGARALVLTYASILNSVATNNTYMSHAVSGASSVSASDQFAIRSDESLDMSLETAMLHTGLTAGSNTFTAKYRVTAGTGTFYDRRIIVFPF